MWHKLQVMVAKFRSGYQTWRLNRAVQRWLGNGLGKSLSWDVSPSEAWVLLETRNSPGWKHLQQRFLGLVGDSIDYIGDSKDMDDIVARKGFRDGVVRTLALIDMLLNQAEESAELKLMERAQKEKVS